MNRREMLRRLKNGEDALDISISKWEDIIEYLESSKRISFRKINSLEGGIKNCALCEIHWENRCATCPIAKFTQKPYCRGTPYTGFSAVKTLLHKEKLLEYAKDELSFLKKLKCMNGKKIEKNNIGDIMNVRKINDINKLLKLTKQFTGEEAKASYNANGLKVSISPPQAQFEVLLNSINEITLEEYTNIKILILNTKHGQCRIKSNGEIDVYIS